MYKVNDDPRSIRSCTLIYQSLLETLEANHYRIDAVSISEVTRRKNIGRATFYRHFDSALDVFRWASNTQVEHAFNIMLLASNNYELLCYSFFSYWHDNTELLDTLVRIQHPDIFLLSVERHLRRNRNLIFSHSELTSMRQDYLIDVWAAIVWSILKRWVLRGKQESANQLTSIAMRNLPKVR